MKNLQKMRQAANLTQQEMAGLLRVTDRTVRNWESGKTKIKYAYIDAIKRVLADASC